MNSRNRRETAGGQAAGARSQRGSGLILALWVISLLSILVASFAFDMHVEAQVVSYYRKRLKAEYLAMAGLERARSLITLSSRINGTTTDLQEDKETPGYAEAKRIKQGLAVEGMSDSLGEGTMTLDIIPDPARRNVNALRDDDWERILAVGGVPQDLWSQIIDSVADWHDPDDSPGLDGAETDDYYAKLEPPYKAKGRNGIAANLDTVEELLLIRGFTPQVLYGGTLSDGSGETNGIVMSGIFDLLRSAAPKDVTVNVNAASRRVLLTLPGLDEMMIDRIVSEREGLTAGTSMGEDRYFQNKADFFARITELNMLRAEDRTYLDSLVETRSKMFRITSRGRVQGVEYKISRMVTIE